ncbi:MAG: Rrf2 family transcriptional regulator [Nitrospirae bacterium]|nr:Rrf2 family transcriptional regulator [Nitrospirota bacterium]
MEITQETDYAVRCVLFLSRTSPEKNVMIEEIAGSMEIPRSFLAKILQKLSKAGIVRSFRGVRGGFRLTRAPLDITLLDVVEAIEGPVTMNKCGIEGKLCNFSGTCTVHPVWKKLRTIVEGHLRSVNFETLKKHGGAYELHRDDRAGKK